MEKKLLKKNSPILVTGASGYIASWIVKLLIKDGYTVHGTVRSLTDEHKIGHLLEIVRNGPGKLKLFEADLLKHGSFSAAMKGCSVVIHTASPFQIRGIKDPQSELVDPALLGTRNVLEEVNRTKTVKRVVLTSSVAAIHGDGIDASDVPGNLLNENIWNTTSSLTHQPYSYSKTLAEREAWRIAELQKRWDLVVINPAFVMGPSLSGRSDGTSVDFLLSFLRGTYAFGMPRLYFGVVDVRDVALAHVRAAHIPGVKGRHIMCADTVDVLKFSEAIEARFPKKFKLPHMHLPKGLMYIAGPFMGMPWKMTSRNVGHPVYYDNRKSREELGITFRRFDETIGDHVEQMFNEGLIR